MAQMFILAQRLSRRCFSTPSISKTCYYNALGLKPGASLEQIKEAYYALSKKYHPDMNAGNPDATTKIQEINEAFEVLGNAAKKVKYDLEIKAQTPNQNKGRFIYDVKEPKFYYYRATPPEEEDEADSGSFPRTRSIGLKHKSAAGINKRKRQYASMNIIYRKKLNSEKFSHILNFKFN